MRSGKHILSATLRQHVRFDDMDQFERELLRLRCHYEVQDVQRVNGKVYVLIDKQYNNVPMNRAFVGYGKTLDLGPEIISGEDARTIFALQQHKKLEASRGGTDVFDRALGLICKLRDKYLALLDEITDEI